MKTPAQEPPHDYDDKANKVIHKNFSSTEQPSSDPEIGYLKSATIKIIKELQVKINDSQKVSSSSIPKKFIKSNNSRSK